MSKRFKLIYDWSNRFKMFCDLSKRFKRFSYWSPASLFRTLSSVDAHSQTLTVANPILWNFRLNSWSFLWNFVRKILQGDLKHGRVFLVSCKTWLFQFTELQRSAHRTSQFLQCARKTRPCLTGHPVPLLATPAFLELEPVPDVPAD